MWKTIVGNRITIALNAGGIEIGAILGSSWNTRACVTIITYRTRASVLTPARPGRPVHRTLEWIAVKAFVFRVDIPFSKTMGIDHTKAGFQRVAAFIGRGTQGATTIQGTVQLIIALICRRVISRLALSIHARILNGATIAIGITLCSDITALLITAFILGAFVQVFAHPVFGARFPWVPAPTAFQSTPTPILASQLNANVAGSTGIRRALT